MDVNTLKMAMSAMEDHKSIAGEVAHSLGITTKTLYSYVYGDGSPKELGTRLLQIQIISTVRTVTIFHTLINNTLA